MHNVSNVVSYCIMPPGSHASLLVGIRAAAVFYAPSAGSVLIFAGYSRYLGDWSISISLDDSSWVLAILLVYTIFEVSGRR